MDGLPSLNGNNLTEEALRMIDESISRQQNVIYDLLVPLLALKSRRNDLVPISRLPPEMLCRIFSFTQVLQPYSKRLERNPLEWINVTYVCRHWRNVALSSPCLWTTPPIGPHRKWVAEMLKRSKDSGLIIQAKYPHTDLGLQVAFRHIHHIRELSIQDISSDLWDLFQKRLPKFAPQLERLRLRGKNLENVSNNLQWRPILISEDCLCDTGRLRELELAHCEVDWNSHSCLFSSLTHLKLHNLSHNSETSGQQFVDALERMPTLNALYLSQSLPRQQSWSSKSIHLAHLQNLDIHGSLVPEAAAFFRCITFPPTAVVQVGFRNEMQDDTDISAVISRLARSYSSPGATFRSLILDQTSPHDYQIQLKFFTGVLTNSEMIHHDGTASLELVFLRVAPNAFDKLLSDIFNNGLPLHDISRVYLPDKIPGLMAETIATTLGKLPLLHLVMAGGMAGKFIVEAMLLGSNIGDAAESGQTPVQMLYFPRVSSIYLFDMAIMEEDGNEQLELSNELSHELLQALLIQRRELGAVIESLTLQACSGVFEKHIILLEGLVEDIDWDAFEYLANNEEAAEQIEELDEEGI